MEKQSGNAWINFFITVFAGLAGLAILYGAGTTITSALSATNPGFGLVAVLILLGLVSTVAVMGILSFCAGWLAITDAKQPFGLPEGSIRAVLTLAFIVLVGVFGAFLITTTDNRSSYAKDKIVVAGPFDTADAAAAQMKVVTGADGILAVSPNGAKFDVTLLPKIDHRLNDDISKQILTMLATILAAMIGFYFGARPGESDPEATQRAQASAELSKAVSASPTESQLAELKDGIDAALKKLEAPKDDKKIKDATALKKDVETLERKLADARNALNDPRSSSVVLKAQKDAIAGAAGSAANFQKKATDLGAP